MSLASTNLKELCLKSIASNETKIESNILPVLNSFGRAFIKLVAKESNVFSSKSNKKRINEKHVLGSLKKLGMDTIAEKISEPLLERLEDQRASAATKRSKKRKLDPKEFEEMKKEQHLIFQEAMEPIKVIVRMRPRSSTEDCCQNIVKVMKDNATICIPDRLSCTYDGCFDESSTQEEVYDFVKASIEQVVQGFNATVFAYGQTGSGKTYTMMGTNDEPGIIPRAVHGLFSEVAELSSQGTTAVIQCSYIQIYNNMIFDLLQDNKRQEPLDIRELVKGGSSHVYVSGASVFTVESPPKMLKLLEIGNKSRKIRDTEYNQSSSRSHVIMQAYIEVESRGGGCATIIRRAKLNLVDLAGSEKWGVDANMNRSRTTEMTNINQSLLALGNVISALTERRRVHIPYRNSKLTRLLQDSLGGNTRSILVATISPTPGLIEETVSTLQFADRAKRVMTRVNVNEVVDDAILLARARKEIASLKMRLKRKESDQVAELSKQIDKLNGQLLSAYLKNKKLQKKIDGMRKTKSATGQVLAKRHMSSSNVDDIAEIQQERKLLEKQLVAPSKEHAVSEDDRCPMCDRLIDLHTDAELDECIILEENCVRDKSSSNPSNQVFRNESPQSRDLIETPSIPTKLQSGGINQLRPQSEERIENDVALQITNSAADIGLLLRVYNYRYDQWYKATVSAFDEPRNLHCVLYEYGDKKWLELTHKKLEILGRSSIKFQVSKQANKTSGPFASKRMTYIKKLYGNNRR